MTGGTMTTPGSGSEFVIGVTSSRTWTDPLKMWAWLDSQYLWAMDNGYRSVAVVHGNAAGGDQIAKLWGLITLSAREISVDADWSGPCTDRCNPYHRKAGRGGYYCPAAGMYRNERMIDRYGVQALGAFIKDHSSGATGCAKYAESRGVKVVEFRA